MMSRISQTDLITNVECSSRIRENHRQSAGERSAFAQILEQEESRLRQRINNGVNSTDRNESFDNIMDGRVHVYDNHGMLNYFQMTISMTDLKG